MQAMVAAYEANGIRAVGRLAQIDEQGARVADVSLEQSLRP